MLTLIKETRKLTTRWTPQYDPVAPVGCGEAARNIEIPDSRQLGRLMDEVACLMRKQVPIAMAVIRADIAPAFWREVKYNLSRIADYFSWVDVGPVLVVAFQKSLFRELLPVWCELSRARSPTTRSVAGSRPCSSSSARIAGAGG